MWLLPAGSRPRHGSSSSRSSWPVSARRCGDVCWCPARSTWASCTTSSRRAFGWTNSHLHQFEICTARYGTPDPDWGLDAVAAESRAKLLRLAEEGSRLTYTYDFGDNWDHHVTVEKVLDAQPGTRYPNCQAGRRACPPEDVGGPCGYSDFLQALNDPKHDEHERWSKWIDGSFDPDAFDLVATDAALDAFAGRRPAPVGALTGGNCGRPRLSAA